MNDGGLPAVLKKTATDARRLAALQAQLVREKVQAQVRQKSIYAAAAVGGAFFAVIGLLFLLAAAAAGLAILLPWWLSLLIVGGVLVLGGGAVVALSVAGLKGKPAD